MKSFWFLLVLCSVLVSFECVGTEREPLEPDSVLCQLLKEKQYEAASVLYSSEHEWKQDQAAQKMLSGLSGPELLKMAESKSGRRLLSTMYAALVTGNSSEEELHDAQRILEVQSLVYYGRDEVQKKLIEAPLKHFPLRLPGVSVTNPTQLRVNLSQDGVQVGYLAGVSSGPFPPSVCPDQTHPEFQTLPKEICLLPTQSPTVFLPEDEPILVTSYDEGGIAHQTFPLHLFALANQVYWEGFKTDLQWGTLPLTIPWLAAEGAILLGARALGASAFRVGLAAVDVLSFFTSVSSQILREHRGWILKQYPKEGPEFLRRVAIVERVSALYGMSRLVLGASVGLGKVLSPTLKNLRQSLVQMQAQARLLKVKATLEQIEKELMATKALEALPNPPLGEPVNPLPSAIEPALEAAPKPGFWLGTAKEYISDLHRVKNYLVTAISRRLKMMFDTSNYTNGKWTLYGGRQNKQSFWKEWVSKYRETISEANMKIMFAEKDFKSPVVDEHWLQYFPEDQPFLGDTLVHHHLGNGKMAIPIPETAHKRIPGFGLMHQNFGEIKALIPNYDTYFPKGTLP